MKYVIAIALIAAGLADLYSEFTGITWLPLSLIGSGLFTIGLFIFTSILKVLLFVLLVLLVLVGVLIGIGKLSTDDIQFYYQKSAALVEGHRKDNITIKRTE